MNATTTLRRAAIGAALGAMALFAGASATLAQDGPAQGEPLKFGLCYDLSNAYTFITPQITQAALDLFELTNLKGGIGGHPVEGVVRDHGNEPHRGIECYERGKREGIFVFEMLSTPVSIAVLPRIMNDENILIQALVGRGDAIDGTVFNWVFPQGPTYLAQAANDIAYFKQLEGGDLTGKTIAFVYLDFAFGQEPQEMLKMLAEREGFELKFYPVALPGNDQSTVWSQVRRDRPDHILAWLLAGQHVTAAKELRRNGIPIDKYLAVNWINEVDIRNIGEAAATGLKRGTNVVGGLDFPLKQELIAELYEKGKGNGPREVLDDSYYNTGLAIYSVALEAARNAYEQSGWPITAQSMKDGYESIDSFDANGLMAPLTITEADHGGGGKTRIEQWDGEKWVPQTDWIAEYSDLIWGIIRESAAEFSVD